MKNTCASSPKSPRRPVWPLLVALLTGLNLYAAESSPRVQENFDLGWKFFQGDLTNAEQATFPDTAWKQINLPHDWSIAGPYAETNSVDPRGGFLPTGIGWYRKHFLAPESLLGKKVSIEFDGVYRDSDVWLNGHFLGHYPFGYLGFNYDLTPFLNFGDTPNVIAVRVDNSQQPNSRWLFRLRHLPSCLAERHRSAARRALGNLCDDDERFDKFSHRVGENQNSK